MQAFLDLDVKRQIERYLTRKTTLNDFKRWLAPVTMDVEQSRSPLAVDLVYEIQLRLAEFSDGYWTEDELRSLLRPLVSTVEVLSPELPRLSARSAVRHSQFELAEVSL
jgi:hypothetical protein